MMNTANLFEMFTGAKSKTFPEARSSQKIPMVVLSLALLFCFGVVTNAQTEQNIQFTQGKVGSGLEFSLAVPIKNLPGRGGTGMNISLNYSSKVWRAAHLATVVADRSGPYEYPTTIAELIYSEWSTAGWNSSMELPRIEWPKITDRYWGYGSAMSPIYASGTTAKRIKKVFIHMPDGSTHELRASDSPYSSPAIDVIGEFYAVDGSRMRYTSTGETTGTLYLPDGTRFELGGSSGDSYLRDRFGDYITRSYTDGKWRDALGREIAATLPANPTANTTTTITVPGLNGDITYILHWKYLADALTPDEYNVTPTLRPVGMMYLPIPGSMPTNFDGNNYPRTIDNPSITLFSDSSDSSDPDAIPPLVVGHAQAEDAVFNPVVLTQIDVPNDTAYEFSYNIYGEIDHVRYPTGATENCTYEMMPGDGTMSSPYDQANRGTKKRSYSAKGDGSDNATWNYSSATNPVSHATTVTMNAPDGSRTESVRTTIQPPKLGTHGGHYWGFDFSDPLSGMVTEERVYASTSNGGALLSRKLTEYERTVHYVQTNPDSKVINAYRNPRPVRETQIIFSGPGNALAKTTTFAYDTTNELTTGVDQTDVVEYGFVSLTNSSASNDAIGSISTGGPLRKVHTTYQTAPGYLSRNILGLATIVSVRDGANNEVARTETAYDGVDPLNYGGTVGFWTDPGSGVKRGLATSVKKYTGFAPSAYIETSLQYDQFGNVRKSWDGNGNLSEIAYDAAHAYAYPTSTISAVPVRLATDATGAHGSSAALLSSLTYDGETGLVLTKTDANGQVSALSYADSLNRPTSVDSPNGGRVEFVYGDSPGNLFIKTRTKLDAANWQETTKYFGGLSRPVKVKQNDAVGDTFVETKYDIMGRPWQSSNPHRAGDTVMWTTTAYDDLGRVMSVTTPDGAAVTTEYGLLTSGGLLGATTLVTDQALKKRKSVTDGLGNLARVIEDPASLAYETNYSYDLLGNLTQVNQAAGAVTQLRHFYYDAASRLTSADNPESGTIRYEYDNNGNLASKTDARGIETTYFYDGLNRVIKRSYAAPTPAPEAYSATSDALYFYDGKGVTPAPSYSLGKLTKVANDESTTLYTKFDVAGRITESKQITGGLDLCSDGVAACRMIYQYNLAGMLTEETYPSGRVVHHSYGADGKLTGISSRTAANRPFKSYAQNFSYSAAGAVTGLQLGNMRWESTTFNSRLQPTKIALGTTPGGDNMLNLEYSYGTSANSFHDNNGNVLTQKITVNDVGLNPGFVATQTYTYDALNRLKSATENSAPSGGSSSQSWKQTYQFDRYGNRNFDTTSGATTTLPANFNPDVYNPSIDPANNRFAANQGYVYDAAGSVKQDSTGKKFVYDGENKQTSFGTGGSATNGGTYVYDGDGNRIKKTEETEVTIFVYDALGKVVAEYAAAAPASLQLNYVTVDMLNTPRVNTDIAGNVGARHDYTPFGEEIFTAGNRGTLFAYGTDALRQKFTGKERDFESNLDYFVARYYSATVGRFSGPDPILISASVENPQTWNRFSHCLNNPLLLVDPTGMWQWSTALGGPSSDDDLRREIRKINGNENMTDEEKADRVRDLNGILTARQNFRDAMGDLEAGMQNGIYSDSDRAAFRAFTSQFGTENDGNNVVVAVSSAQTGLAFTREEGGKLIVAFRPDVLLSRDISRLTGAAFHESVHLFQSNYQSILGNASVATSELSAYMVFAKYAAGQYLKAEQNGANISSVNVTVGNSPVTLWKKGMTESAMKIAVMQHLQHLTYLDQSGRETPLGAGLTFPGGGLGQWH